MEITDIKNQLQITTVHNQYNLSVGLQTKVDNK